MKKPTILLYLFTISFISLACLWDRDTITFEKEQFPSTLEIITGNFIRHSPEFYQWRIKDREEKLKTNPEEWHYYDDLAVAYDKTGNHSKAIELMLQKEKLYPNQYETYANLGTFYIHNKAYKKGLQYIDKAIKINPDAHFGREIYQKYLVEYLLSKKKNGYLMLPLNPYTKNDYYQSGFYFYLKKRQKEEFNTRKARLGLMGMVKFGKHNSPILMEALGDLLAGERKNIPNNAPYLAYMAYKRASMLAKYTSAKQLYNKKNPTKDQWAKLKYYMPNRSKNISLQEVISHLDRRFANEIKKGQKLAQQIRSDEIRWIATGADPEAKFDKKYLKKDEVIKYMDWALKERNDPKNRKLPLKKVNADRTIDSNSKVQKQKSETEQDTSKPIPYKSIAIIAIAGIAIVLIAKLIIPKK